MNSLPKLVIVGAGGFGRECLAWARQCEAFGRDWTIKGFIDDNIEALRGKNTPAPLLGKISDYSPAADERFVIALGVPAIRRRVAEALEGRGALITGIEHRTAILGDNVSLGVGCILCPYAVVSGNNRLGRGVVVNVHASVDHDANVGDWSQINCHCDLTAAVELGREVFLGSSVSIIPGVCVGDGAYIGAGAVVLRDVPAGAKQVGVPARPIRSLR